MKRYYITLPDSAPTHHLDTAIARTALEIGAKVERVGMQVPRGVCFELVQRFVPVKRESVA